MTVKSSVIETCLIDDWFDIFTGHDQQELW
jgi:hypothetical protein